MFSIYFYNRTEESIYYADDGNGGDASSDHVVALILFKLVCFLHLGIDDIRKFPLVSITSAKDILYIYI